MEAQEMPQISSAAMQLLLVGDNDDFSYLRDLLSRTGDGHVGLDHAHSTEEALAAPGSDDLRSPAVRIQIGRWRGLASAARIAPEPSGAPVIFLSDHMDETTVDKALKAGRRRFRCCSRVLDEPADHQHDPLCHRRSIARNGSAKKRRIRCANYGARSSNRPTWS